MRLLNSPLLFIAILSAFVWLAHASLHRDAGYDQSDVTKLNNMVGKLTKKVSADQKKALIIANIWNIEASINPESVKQ